jgi:predicted nucleic acid-binding protein
MMPSAYVMDTSVTLSWFFEDEATPGTSELFESLPDAQVTVPELWLFELSNALLVAERRRRTTDLTITRFLDRLFKQSISVERTSADRALSSVRSVARTHGLSVYGATYLELALRSGLPLATHDSRLSKAAKAARVTLVPL